MQHQSCLLLTSREKPTELVPLGGETSPARSLVLPGLKQGEGQELLKDKKLSGSDEDWTSLINFYSGNPLALKLASEAIQELFGGDISQFLNEGEILVGNIDELLDHQLKRLSRLD